MKKSFFVILILINCNVFSQQRNKGDVELTTKIGYSSANYYSEENLSNKPISGVNFGLETDYFFNNRWSLHSGLLYQRMGSKLGSEYKEKLGYLTVPINANWHFGSTRKWYLNFGPSVGFLMSAKAEYKGNNFNSFDPIVYGEEQEVNIKSLANKVQLGLNYGIGYKIFINEKFSISVDYQGMTGLSNVPKESQYSIKNTYASFNVGGVFNL